jgi:alkanesulfonate monooxygenase SsuD/methylene tetrahydromethanopterin reductase-like flavin-dependent oxidoreductase (luciferase family)
MSGGRIELGLGAGWYENEHVAYGIPFPEVSTRFDRFEEQLAIVTGLWQTAEGDTYSFDGDHYVLANSPALPKPIQPGGPPIIVGGKGPHRTPALAARYAAEFNVAFAPVKTFTVQRDRVVAACEKIDRDPATMMWSTAVVVCAAVDEAGVRRRAAAIGREADDLRRNDAAGTIDETAATLRSWIDAGVDRIYLQILDLADLDHLDVLATEVAPLLI